MSEDHSYNGWSNYETWAVNLWLGNDPGTMAAAEDAVRDGGAEGLKALVTDAAPDLGASMYSDLLGAALSDVDWYEIAYHYEAAEQESEDHGTARPRCITCGSDDVAFVDDRDAAQERPSLKAAMECLACGDTFRLDDGMTSVKGVRA